MAGRNTDVLFARVQQSHAATLALLDPERLLDNVDQWRRLAAEWTERARIATDPGHASMLRTRAQLALYAAHDAEQVFRMREAHVAGAWAAPAAPPPPPALHAAPRPRDRPSMNPWLRRQRRYA